MTTRWLNEAQELAAELATTVAAREQREELPHEPLNRLRASGLVNLLIPTAFGGEGGTLRDAVEVVSALARGDASVAALLGFHYYVSAVPRLWDPVGEAERFERQSAEGRWLWANVHQPRQKDFVARPTDDGGFVIDGVKPWNTGVTLADVTTVIAQRTDRPELLFAVIPTDRAGIRLRDDWDHLGLRLAEPVTAEFDAVIVRPDEVIPATGGGVQDTFPPLYTAYSASLYGAVLLGTAWGAVDQARRLLRERPVARAVSGVERATEDPLALQLLGASWAQLHAVEALLLEVADEIQDHYDRRDQLDSAQRAALSIRARVARAHAAEVGLAVTQRVFEVVGTSGAGNDEGLDRPWRDIRTLSLHDPLILSLRNIGDLFLNGDAVETPSFVS